MTAEVDAVVVGAGVAGLAAAAAFRRAGRTCVTLEATGRIGGRAFTDHPAALGGSPFDRGASWLHAAERNPLADLARAAGIALSETRGAWTRRVLIDGRAATAAELDAYARAWERFDQVARARAAAGPDTSLADAVGRTRRRSLAGADRGLGIHPDRRRRSRRLLRAGLASQRTLRQQPGG